MITAMTKVFRSRHHKEILLADWRDAEELAAWYMCEVLGMQGARTTGAGNDKGIDVVSDHGVAQVKHMGVPSGAPIVQSALGAGHGKVAVLFFSLSGFTRQAEDFAEQSGVALFTYDIYGEVRAGNDYARTLVSRGGNERKSTVDEVRLDELREKARPAVAKLDKCRHEVEAFASKLDRTTGLESDPPTLGTIVREYAELLRDVPEPSLEITLDILKDSRNGMTRTGLEGKPAIFSKSAVEAGCQALLDLYEEIADTEALRRLTAGQWARKFFDWKIRVERIQYFIKYAEFSPYEKEPILEATELKFTRDMGIGNTLNVTIATTWTWNGSAYGELSAYLAAAEMDPIGWGTDYCKGLLEHYSRVEFNDDDEDEDDLPRSYPLGYTASDIDRIKQALAANI